MIRQRSLDGGFTAHSHMMVIQCAGCWDIIFSKSAPSYLGGKPYLGGCAFLGGDGGSVASGML